MNSRWSADLKRIAPYRASNAQLLTSPPANDQDRRWQERVRANQAEAAELNAEIEQAGVPFSVGELGNVSAPYPEIIPILVRHLSKPYSNDIRDAIVRALTEPYAGDEALNALLQLLGGNRDSLDKALLFAVGNAITVLAGSDRDDLLYAIAQDAQNGPAALKPLLQLSKVKDSRAKDLAIQWLRERKLPWAALNALRTLQAWDARSVVEPYAGDKDGDLRSEARKFLRAADKAITPTP